MKYLYQFTVILGISLVGEFLHALLPFPFPASIYGLILMLLLLRFGVVKLDQVKDAGGFLLAIMACMFIPPAVGLIAVADEALAMLLPLAVCGTVITALVIGVTGKVSDLIIDRTHKKDRSVKGK